MTGMAKITTTGLPVDVTPAIATDDRAYIRLGLRVLLLTFGLLFGWAAVAPLQSAVVAAGRLVAASQNKTVQHLDGGLVEEILVADGDRVEAGQPLLRLDAQPLQIQLGNIRGQLFELQANLERLTAERGKDTDLVFSPQLLKRVESDFQREILDTQLALFRSRREAVSSEREMLEQRSKQATTQIVGLNSALRSMRQRNELLEKDLSGLQRLNAGKLVSTVKVRELQRRLIELGGEVAEREAEVAGLRESIAENNQQMMLRQQEYQREVVTTLRDLQAQLIGLEARRQAVSEKLSRITITAPAAGKIKGFRIVTAGEVIPAGAPIMEIVPLEPHYRIHARISPMDVDVLHPGIQAEVRLSAIDGAGNFPVIYADLENLSADAFTDEARDAAYYMATLVLDRAGLDVLADEDVHLMPGMPVDVFIKTGERTFFDYLTRPLQDLLARALNEA